MSTDMSTDATVDNLEDVDTTTDTDTTTDATDKPEGTEPDTVPRAEFQRSVEQRQKLKAELDKLKADLKALKNPKPDTDKGEPDPADTLRTALRRTAAVSVLTGRGITDKADQDAVLSVLHLDALDIADDGTVDTDMIADTLDTLGRIFGKGADKPKPPRVDTRRGQGDSGSGTDPDRARYLRIINGR